MEKNTKVVLFSRPIWLSVKKNRSGIRTIIEILGFIINVHNEFHFYQIEDYIDYLAGSSIWQSAGGDIDILNWISTNGNIYDHRDPLILEFQEKARQDMNVTYRIYETNAVLDEHTKGLFNAHFIVSRELYDKIMNYGAIYEPLDVKDEFLSKWQDKAITRL